MASDLLVIVDDSSSDIRYSGADWQVSGLVQWYGGTSRFPIMGTGGSARQFGSFSMNFEGRSIAFYGTTPARTSSQTFSVSIDGAAPSNVSYGDPNPPSYRQWFQSPELADGRHNITVEMLDGPMFDFAAVAASPDTPLNGKRLVVDDDNALIQYHGNWKRSEAGFHSKELTDGVPFRNGTHQSWSAGDGLSFTFTGTSLAVYGIFSWDNLGLLSVTYSIDGKPFQQSYSVTTSSPEYVNKIGDASNFLFYASDTISAGEHTLVIDITQSSNQSFILDYITYSPSFPTLGRMANLTTTSAKSSSTAGSGGGIPNPITTAAGDQHSVHQVPAGAIVGGIVGGIFFVALIGLLIWFLRRRAKKNRKRAHRKRYGSGDISRPLMQDTLRSTERSYATRPISSASHRSVSPYPFSYVPEIPDSKQYRRDETQRAGQEARTRPAIPLIRTGSLPGSNQDHNSHSPIERPRGSFESFYTQGGHRELSVERPRVEFTDSPSSGMLSPYYSAGISTQSALPSATIMRQADAAYSPRTNDPARDSAYRPRGLEHRSRSESDNGRYTNSVQQVSSSPPRLTPVRRGFSDSPSSGTTSSQSAYVPMRSSRLASVPDLRQVQWEAETAAQFERPRLLLAPLGSLPEDEGLHRALEQGSPPREREHRSRPRTVQPQQSQERLSPLRRAFAEPPASAPIAATRTSPMASVFPRLSSILAQHSRFLIRDVPEDVSEGDGYSDSEVPPAYESLTPRRGPSQASQQHRSSVRPLPVPTTPSPEPSEPPSFPSA
ncbi:hypothetical protein M413DRAFT_23136 [Hebeloma cylindrosporum]|uniref:receptor protein-tyrosine kinase n=1 Tax=Hebeloma cylindrosporum TaxID=76867 RepID=A0A0C3CSB5_HEBCY|nr:hypothetical protein M413DRAFT_23136 [Hebeloma cylindrosporum h7]